MKNTSNLFVCCLFVLLSLSSIAQNSFDLVQFTKSKNDFVLAENGKVAGLLVGQEDYPGVVRAAGDLLSDIQKVTGVKPKQLSDLFAPADYVIYVGTVGKSKLINALSSRKKINVEALRGKWEAYQIEVVDNPFPGIKKALVVAGSDKRGTIYGIYELSAKIGVSPWYWWADVPVKKHSAIYCKSGKFVQSEPVVKYRGIFINDEAPALSGWTHEKNGGFNRKLYERVFELILRMKGNYLWPAMWGNAFNDDDKMNPVLADEYGVVMGTSHHEPMQRAQQEWKRYGKGAWNYDKNDSVLREFWSQGIKNMGTHESIVTIGMRGDGDEPMSEENNISLLERIVKDQRQIIQQVTGKPIEQTPQMWALYKEVQEYYDKGMRVPDDVTLLLCDDNWGNIRKLPNLKENPRTGGYGIYYHFDYVGGPRNYKWLNTNPIPKIWEQMNLAWKYGATQIWIVNVGDIKPMEFPIEFFLDFAWNPAKIPADSLAAYTSKWTASQFGAEYSGQIAQIISTYLKLAGSRKPELINAETYNLANGEWERIVNQFRTLNKIATQTGKKLSAEYQDAYYQLVLHPVEALTNFHELYYSAALNQMYARQGRNLTNEMADNVRKYFEKDSLISHYYNTIMAGGKWNHFMDQTHIGYTYWQQPPVNLIPKTARISVPENGDFGVMVYGSADWRTSDSLALTLTMDRNTDQEKYFIEIFNRGKNAVNYKMTNKPEWLDFSQNPVSRSLETVDVHYPKINWDKLPFGETKGQITFSSVNQSVTIIVKVIKTEFDHLGNVYVCNASTEIDAAKFSRQKAENGLKWTEIPDLGKWKSGMMIEPVTAESLGTVENCPFLEYDIYVQNPGEVKVQTFTSPTLNFRNNEGLRFAVAIDDEKPQIVNMHADKSMWTWEKWVIQSAAKFVTNHVVKQGGKHILRVYLLDAGIVLQRMVVSY
jgi:hypothetical protein